MAEHRCHAEGCQTPVPPKMFMCRPHWFSLSKTVRKQIWRTYRPGQEQGRVRPSKAYLDATAKAIRSLAERTDD